MQDAFGAICSLQPNGDLFIRKRGRGVMFVRLNVEGSGDYSINRHNDTNLLDYRAARPEDEMTLGSAIRNFIRSNVNA